MEKGGPGHYPAPLRSARNRRYRPGDAGNSGEFLAVAIGLSADALDACSKTVLSAMPSGIGIVFFLVDDTGSLYNRTIVYLLSNNALVTVRETSDGSPIEGDHLYVLLTGSYKSVSSSVSRPLEPGARRHRAGTRDNAQDYL
jgi:chemotaxis response regulator CheB